ncbi:hypothetical protein A2U01_0104904, partial [Trifolium medium]|nr:hypothetical protein [Trifolium medium]
MISLIVKNITSQQYLVFIQTPHSSEDPFNTLNPTLSTIGIITPFEDRRFVVHEPLKSELILSA